MQVWVNYEAPHMFSFGIGVGLLDDPNRSNQENIREEFLQALPHSPVITISEKSTQLVSRQYGFVRSLIEIHSSHAQHHSLDEKVTVTN